MFDRAKRRFDADKLCALFPSSSSSPPLSLSLSLSSSFFAFFLFESFREKAADGHGDSGV